MKTCRLCKEEKPLTGFSTNGKSGHHPVCKECRSKLSREDRLKNGDRIRALEAEKYKRNKEEMRMANKAYCDRIKDRRSEIERERYQAESEAIKARVREYRLGNPAKVRSWNGARRAAQRMAMSKWADRKEIAAIYAEALKMFADTGVEYHVDHIIPLTHPMVCGLHVAANLQILTCTENLKKSNSFHGSED